MFNLYPMKSLSGIILLFALALSVNSCYYDNEEDIYLGSSACDTTNVTYSKSIAPVFGGYCNSCHSGSNPGGNIVTDNYTSVKANITRIKGAINHYSGFLAMPQSGGKLSDCDLTKMDIWIKQGMPNN